MFVDSSVTLLPEELHIAALDTIVQCIPNSDIDKHKTLFKIYGPFQSNMPCEMPLYMALHCKVTIECPIYYQNQELDKLLKLEIKTQQLERLPHRQFFEIGFILKFNVKKLNDFRNIRYNKALALLQTMNPRLCSFGYPTVYESNMLRPVLSPLFAYLDQFDSREYNASTYDQIKRNYNQVVSQIQEIQEE